MTPETIRQVIESRFDTLSPELQRAARWVARHGELLALHSMRQSSKAAGVTPATMSRLAQRLGFDGFEALRMPFRRHLAGATSRAEVERVLNQRVSGTQGANLFGPLNTLQQANAASAISLNRTTEIEATAQTLIDAAHVSFLGLRVCHGVAYCFAYAYGFLRANGTLVTGIGGTLRDQIVTIGEGGVLVAISQSPYTRDTVEAVALARKSGSAVIALTDSPLSPLARGAKHVLLYDTSSNAHFNSVVGVYALAETLIAAVAARGGEATKQYLRRTQAHLRNTRAYWERQDDKGASRQ